MASPPRKLRPAHRRRRSLARVVSGRSHSPLEELKAPIKAITGRAATAEQLARFERYLELFMQWNLTHRMTALRSPDAVVRGLFVDSLLFLRLLPEGPVRVVDIGAGAGIPGLPMKLADPRIALTLIEARRKRVSFLLAVCRELGLPDVAVKEGRAEDLIGHEPGLQASFDFAVCRAVGPVGRLFPVARQFLKPGGQLLVSGPPDPRIGPPFEVVRVPVPGSARPRVFLRATKEG